MIGLAVRGAEHPLGVGRDQRAPREDAEVDGLEMGEEGVVALDRHHRLPGLDRVAVVEGEDLEPVPVVGAELEHRDRLVHAAEHGGVALEDLHQDARVAAVGEQRRAGVVEVRVGVVALPHLLDGKVEHVWVEPLAARRTVRSRRPLRPRGRRRAPPRRPRAARPTAPPSRCASAGRGRDAREHARAAARGGGPSSRRSRPRRPSAPTAPSARAAGRAEAGARAASALAAALVSEQRADEVAAAAVVLLRRRLAGLVRADRDVLGAVVRGELAAAERDHGGRERGERGDCLAARGTRAASGERRPLLPLRRRPRPRRAAARTGSAPPAGRGARRGAPRTPRRAAAGRGRTASSRSARIAAWRPRPTGSSRRTREPRRPTRSGRARARRSRAPCRRAAASPCGEGTVLRWTPVRCST